MHCISKILSLLLIALCMVAPGAMALPADAYAPQSRLSSGRWVKVAVTASGVHRITAEQLRQWGFSDPSKVEVYGYGGARIPDVLSAEHYVDDLPQVQTIRRDNGDMLFYAQGPVQWVGPDLSGWFHQRLNPYTTKGFYFLSDTGDAPREIPVEGLTDTPAEYATTVIHAVYHEQELTSPGQSGHILVGEDFRFTPKRTVELEMPGRVEGTPLRLRMNVATMIKSGSASLTLSANGVNIAGGAASLTANRGNTYCDTTQIVRGIDKFEGPRLTLGMNYTASGVVNLAALDYVTVNYTRRLTLDKGIIDFGATTSSLSLEADGSTVVLDVTNPRNVIRMNTVTAGSSQRWVSERGGFRRYSAFSASAALPSPEYVGTVSATNFHAAETPDMVIFSPAAYLSQAQRIAQMHLETDSMRVLVANVEDVYNEFASGMADVSAMRRMLKMFWDRGADAGNHRLQYALLLSRPHYDHRGLTPVMQGTAAYPVVPMWQTDAGCDESYSYGNDDFIGMLADGSGSNRGNDEISIAVGRIPVRNATELQLYVDKLIAYVTRPPEGDWKNKLVIVADDQDNGIHMEQAENTIGRMLGAPQGHRFMYNKVYLDAYEKQGGVTEGARTDMYKLLNEGSAWWMYIGHASIDTWSGEGILRRNDILNNLYFKKLPILYAATCSFLHWDSDPDSGAEMMLLNPNGGIIATICPSRPVYISANGVLSGHLGNVIHDTDDDGRFLTVGEILRRAKNRSRNDLNKLRYHVGGDPAMRVPMPDREVQLTMIDGKDASANAAEDDLPVVPARRIAKFEGEILRPDGKVDEGFNGRINMSIFDAENTVTTLGRGDDSDPGKVINFEAYGTRLYAGCDSVRAGRFTVNVAMPTDIADNYRPAAVNLYAVGTEGEAAGFSRNLIVYGMDENATTDENAPAIDALYLNHESFASGDAVNESPMMFAHVSDDLGINLSLAGIGHTLMLKLDDSKSLTDVSSFYTPSADGSASGTVAYPLSNLTAGNHTLELRVSDTSNNITRRSIEFYVQPGLAPEIFEVYTDASPASDRANFYIRHNRPDATLNVTIGVYDLLGRQVWSASQTGRSDMFVSTPLTWDLSHSGGARVARGVYVYRATVSTDGENETSKGGRIAVAGTAR